MDLYHFLKWLHVIGATVLLGTGAGIAFFMMMAHRTRDAKTIADVASIVVVADYAFTLSAVIAQPITGLGLAHAVGYPLTSGWIALSVALYFFTGAFWVPVVFMQRRMRDLARIAARDGAPLPGRVFPPLPPLVRLRLSGVLRGAHDFLADDRAAGDFFLSC